MHRCPDCDEECDCSDGDVDRGMCDHGCADYFDDDESDLESEVILNDESEESS